MPGANAERFRVNGSDGRIRSAQWRWKNEKKQQLQDGKLIWNPKMEVWKMNFLFNWVMLRFYVTFSSVYRMVGFVGLFQKGCSAPAWFWSILDGSKKAGKTKHGSRCAGAEAGIRVPTRKLKRSYWILSQ